MTAPDRPSAAGVFVVRDPAVCAALEQLLAPHRTDPTLPPAAPAAQVAALMADAEARAGELTGAPAGTLAPDVSIEQILDHVHQAAHAAGHAVATVEADGDLGEVTGRLRRAETNLSHADREVEKTTAQLRDAVARIADLEVRLAAAEAAAEAAETAERPQTRRPTVSALRLKDQSAFASLARRMEDQAAAKPKSVGDVLRIAARAVRDEIEQVYGPEAKAS